MEKHNKMLIDATHPEETRVVVLRNGRVEEFDYESAARKLLRGNIYLAKVTRVEPSLQAAFVDYGGNRHGFLAFNEIHPDYYQIPVADREALKQEEAEEEARAEAEADERARRREWRRSRNDQPRRHHGGHPDQAPAAAAPLDEYPDAQSAGHVAETGEAGHETGGRVSETTVYDVPYQEVAAQPLAIDEAEHRLQEAPHPAAPSEPNQAETAPAPVADAPSEAPAPIDAPVSAGHPVETKPHDPIEVIDFPEPHGNVEDVGVIDIDGNGNGNGEPEQIEEVTTEEDALEEVPERTRRRMRQYKIQEVIKRRQIILVQVVKEERGNKGAALTTYISLAGRYTVLMPNTGRGGGISRKITQPQDRKRLKAIAEELDVPEGMGLIIRTAGAARTKQEIKRDYEYLLRLWESVRELTLSSTAPCLVYEEGNLIKRSIRDLYSREIDEVVVAGDEAHHEAQDFMGMLMPGHADNVTSYRGSEPLFTRFGIERQLNAMFSPYVTLRSGGYLVINQTEALVAIDVNSGKSTREFSIEETALNTNMEAAEEIARQLKLRDLAGLIVVDFIDMEEKRNNRSVERRLKDALRNDRARIQVGRISHFGLLEMSRQRLRTGVLEGSTSQCPHCQGTGIIRSTESVALAVLRGLEDQLMKQPSSLAATTTSTVALYILNNKRPFIHDMESRHGITIAIEASDRMQGANFSIERTAAPVHQKPAHHGAVSMDWGFEGEDAASAEPEQFSEKADNDDQDQRHSHAHGANRDDADGGEGEAGGEQRQGGRRRRRRRGRRDRVEGTPSGQEAGGQQHQNEDDHAGSNGHEDAEQETEQPVSGHSHRHSHDDDQAERPEDGEQAVEILDVSSGDDETTEGTVGAEGGERQGERRRRGRRRGRRGGRGREYRDQNGAPLPYDIAQPGAEQPQLGDTAPREPSWSSTHYARIDDHQNEHPPVALAPVSEEASPPGIVEIVSFTEQRIETVEPMHVVEYGQAPEQPNREPVGAGMVESSAEARPSEVATVVAPAPEPEVAMPAAAVSASETIGFATPVETAAAIVQASTASVMSDAPPVAQPVQTVSALVAEAAVQPAPPAEVAAGEPTSASEMAAPLAQVAPVAEVVEPAKPAAPPRKGWWQRRFGSGSP